MAARILISLAFILASQTLHAQVMDGFSINSDSASVVGVDPADATKWIMYGGYAEDVGGCAVGTRVTTAVCDSCTALDLGTVKVCNNRSVFNDLVITFNIGFKTIPANTGEIKAFFESKPVSLTTTYTGITANTIYPVTMTWSALCEAASSGGTSGSACSSQTTPLSFTGTLKIGLKSATSSTDTDANSGKSITVKFRKTNSTTGGFVTSSVDVGGNGCSTGFCNYTVYPGDSKVYVENVLAGSTGPTTSIKWSAMRVYYNTGKTSNINPRAGFPPQDLSVMNRDSVTTAADIRLSPNYVDGLTNEQEYNFLIASVDETGNVEQFYDPSIYVASTSEINKHTATPGEVIGLLKNKKCFVATAAYGSSMAPQVEMLRKFRNKYLLNHFVGREFVKFYYKYSPPFADFIAEHDSLRAVARAVLWPFVTVADWVMSEDKP